MATTDLAKLPYPVATDTPHVHLDMRNLAEAVDAHLPVVQTEAPPHRRGRQWLDAAGRLWLSNGTTWTQVGGPPQVATLSYAANYRHGASPLVFARIGSQVIVSGSFSNAQAIGNAAADTHYTLGTLPDGWRPTEYVKLPLTIYQGYGNAHAGELRVNADGSMSWAVYGYAQATSAAIGTYDGAVAGAYTIL